MKTRDSAILSKIESEALAIANMIQGINCNSFLENDEKQRAVCMTLINIGELVKHLTNEFRIENKHVPWKKVAGLRDVAVHGYHTLDMQDVWMDASMHVPTFLAQLQEILGK